MCPLRLILIFLSATLAGFLVLKNLKSHPKIIPEDPSTDSANPTTPLSPLNRSSKVWGAIGTSFWTFVDMASGRYLWRNLVSSSSKCTN